MKILPFNFMFLQPVLASERHGVLCIFYTFKESGSGERAYEFGDFFWEGVCGF